METGFFSLFNSTYNINGSLVQGQERAGRNEKATNALFMLRAGPKNEIRPKERKRVYTNRKQGRQQISTTFFFAFKGREEGHAWRFDRDCLFFMFFFFFPISSFDIFLFLFVFLIATSGIQRECNEV